MRRLLIAVPLLFLALTATAFGGGWATVGMSSTPEGVQPGKPWVVDMTILQHGRTPLQDLNPTLTIVNGDNRQTFHAKESKEPGVYRVSVTFPSSGLWRYEVNDGFVTGTSMPTSRCSWRALFSDPRSTRAITTPEAPARAVRPERWTYVAESAGGSKCTTAATSSTCTPRAATSVATSASTSPSTNDFNALSRFGWLSPPWIGAAATPS